LSNVIPLNAARSYVDPDRYYDINAMAHLLSVSTRTLKNYAKGTYWSGGEYHEYEHGPMPHLRLPSGQLRFNLQDCKAWLSEWS
jgi:hypothetical protein